jgi:hypothetical protein
VPKIGKRVSWGVNPPVAEVLHEHVESRQVREHMSSQVFCFRLPEGGVVRLCTSTPTHGWKD